MTKQNYRMVLATSENNDHIRHKDITWTEDDLRKLLAEARRVAELITSDWKGAPNTEQARNALKYIRTMWSQSQARKAFTMGLEEYKSYVDDYTRKLGYPMDYIEQMAAAGPIKSVRNPFSNLREVKSTMRRPKS